MFKFDASVRFALVFFSLAGGLRASAADEAGALAVRARFATPLAELNQGACRPGQTYVQEDLREPSKILPIEGVLETQLVVSIRERCVPVWVPAGSGGSWQMQTLKLRTYGFPRDMKTPITEADADDPRSSKIAWSAPGPTWVMSPATSAGAPDGTHFKMRLYNRMPFQPNDNNCVPNLKCNTKGPNSGVDPTTGKCKEAPNASNGGFPAQTPHQTVNGQVIEPPNCFHGLNNTNFHFHGFHVSPQLPQDNVSLELRPPLPKGVAVDHAAHGAHGPDSPVFYGHFDYDLDPLRYTQAPGTHWYHAHKHGSTALQVLNGQVGAVEIRGEFDQKLDHYFKTKGGGELIDRLMVVQQLQEMQPGLGGADQTGAVLVNGQGNPIVHMKRGEIQRWRFVGATMQASASLQVGFPDIAGKPSPQVRQIAMDGVQFSPNNYVCQPFLNNPDCTPAADNSSFNELTTFSLAPGNRVDILVQAPSEAGKHCMALQITSGLAEVNKAKEALRARAAMTEGTCGTGNGLGPLFTLVVDADSKPMKFPGKADYPALPPFLADLPAVTSPELQKTLFYEMVNQGDLVGTQFWINQLKYDPSCANETLTIDQPEQWTLRNNSFGVAHPFHIHQNPFQLLSQSDRGTYKYPVWRDVMAIPTATTSQPAAATAPDADPDGAPIDSVATWGSAVITYVAKEFTGGFVNHCHILGHEDRGMMHNTQAVCPNDKAATTGPVPPGAKCDSAGFCPSDCVEGKPVAVLPACLPLPGGLPQQSWPTIYGYPPKP